MFLVLWWQITDYARNEKRPLILTTDDTKEDWWWEHEGRTIGPRPELVQEVHSASGQQFYMYSAERFIDRAQKMLELQDQQAARAVEEARLAREQAAKAQANRYAGAAWAALERAVEDVGNNSMLKLAWQAQAEERANKALRDLFSSPQYDQLQAILRWASWNPGPLAAEYGYGNLSDKLRTVGDMEKALRDVERSERQEPEDKPEGDK